MATPATQPQTAGKTPPPPPPRMTLKGIIKGKQPNPLRVFLFGVEGIGKSTFAAGAPHPIFLGAEDGTAHMDVERLPNPENWKDVKDGIRLLTNEAHEYQTLVIDTVDWAEPLLWQHCYERDGFHSIEDYGYGKGYTAALDEWRVFVAALEKLRAAKHTNVILLGHSWIKPFKNPTGDDFDRYEPKVHAKAGGLLKEWCDCVLFANYETFSVKDEKTKRVKGVSSGARLIYTNRTAAYDAKNRHDLPDSLPLSWDDFAEAVAAHAPADPAVLRKACEEKAKALGGDFVKQTAALLTKFWSDAAKLAQVHDRLTARLSEKVEA